jgi:hypothetical protein
LPRIPLRYSIPVAFPDWCGLDRVDAALAFTANNDPASGRRVVASIMSRLTSSDTCNAVFDVVHFGTYARAYAVRQASRSPTAPINGETHTQVRRGVFRPTLSTLLFVPKRARNGDGAGPTPQTPGLRLRASGARGASRVPSRTDYLSVGPRPYCTMWLRSNAPAVRAGRLSWSEIQSPTVSQGQRMVSPAARISNARAARALCRAARRSERAIFSLVSRALVGPKSSDQIG